MIMIVYFDLLLVETNKTGIQLKEHCKDARL